MQWPELCYHWLLLSLSSSGGAGGTASRRLLRAESLEVVSHHFGELVQKGSNFGVRQEGIRLRLTGTLGSTRGGEAHYPLDRLKAFRVLESRAQQLVGLQRRQEVRSHPIYSNNNVIQQQIVWLDQITIIVQKLRQRTVLFFILFARNFLLFS